MESQKKFICENCGKEHDGSYGNGRFCSEHCGKSFCGKKSKVPKEGGWTCICGENFRTRKEMQVHFKECDIHIEFVNLGVNQYNKARVLGLPIPKYICSEETKEKLSKNNSSHRDEIRKKISRSMFKAHEEGRAGIWPKISKGEHSYPEQCLINDLKKYLNFEEGKDYITEYRFHGQYLDFAWPDLKISIEMDGSQHERFEDQIESDKRKDTNLDNDGWKHLRIKWKDYTNNYDEQLEKVINLFR